MTKRLTAVLLTLVFAIGMLSGCSEKPQTPDDGRISIICTVFPVYDWLLEIIGEDADKFNIKLLGNGGDLHSYQPTASDIAMLHNCDLLIYVGGESDKWVEEIIGEESLNSLKLFDVNKEALLHEEHEHSHEEGMAYDEHIWLSLRLAKRSVDAIGKKVSEIVPGKNEEYEKNAQKYCQRLDDLNKEYIRAVGDSEDKTIIFADRFPFIYLTEDYDIKCYAAFPGCSADTDASFETVIELAEEMKRLDKNTVLVLENQSQTVVDAVTKAAGKTSAKIEVMNSCQTVRTDATDKKDYLEIMKENLAALSEALK